MNKSPEQFLEDELKALALRQPSRALDDRVMESISDPAESSSLSDQELTDFELQLKTIPLMGPSDSLDEKVRESLQPLPENLENLEAQLIGMARRQPSQMLDLRIDQAMKEGYDFSDEELEMVEALADLRLLQVPESLDQKMELSLAEYGALEMVTAELSDLRLTSPGAGLDQRINDSLDAFEIEQASELQDMNAQLSELTLKTPSAFLDQRVRTSLRTPKATQSPKPWLAWAPAIAAIIIIGLMFLPILTNLDSATPNDGPGTGPDDFSTLVSIGPPVMPEHLVELHTVSTEVIPGIVVPTEEGALKVWHIRHVETTTLEDLNEEVTITITNNTESTEVRDLELF